MFGNLIPGFGGGGFVVGVEGDVDGADDHSTRAIGTLNESFRNGIQGSARGRVGIAIDRALFYATGGAAFAAFTDDFASPRGFDTFTHTRVGYTVGGGVEYAINPNFALRAEYRYSDFGTLQLGLRDGLPPQHRQYPGAGDHPAGAGRLQLQVRHRHRHAGRREILIARRAPRTLHQVAKPSPARGPRTSVPGHREARTIAPRRPKWHLSGDVRHPRPDRPLARARVIRPHPAASGAARLLRLARLPQEPRRQRADHHSAACRGLRTRQDARRRRHRGGQHLRVPRQRQGGVPGGDRRRAGGQRQGHRDRLHGGAAGRHHGAIPEPARDHRPAGFRGRRARRPCRGAGAPRSADVAGAGSGDQAHPTPLRLPEDLGGLQQQLLVLHHPAAARPPRLAAGRRRAARGRAPGARRRQGAAGHLAGHRCLRGRPALRRESVRRAGGPREVHRPRGANSARSAPGSGCTTSTPIPTSTKSCR